MNKLSYIFMMLMLTLGFGVNAQDDVETTVGGAETTTPTETVSTPNTEQAGAETGAEPLGSIRAEDNNGINPISQRPIHLSDQMYRKTIWRALDLREKQNKPIFSKGNEVPRIIIDAVQAGKLTPYENDSLLRPLTIEEFNKRITIPTEDAGLSDEEKALGFSDEEEDDDWGGEEEEAVEESGSDFYFPNQLYQMEIREDMIFDKQRSRMYNDMQAITIQVPAGETLKGIQENIGSFRYSDMIQVFREDPRAIWFNPQNDAEHKNIAEAFELRLFSSYIIKVSNPDDLYLSDIYGTPEDGIRASQKTMWDLLEYEHNLWEF